MVGPCCRHTATDALIACTDRLAIRQTHTPLNSQSFHPKLYKEKKKVPLGKVRIMLESLVFKSLGTVSMTTESIRSCGKIPEGLLLLVSRFALIPVREVLVLVLVPQA